MRYQDFLNKAVDKAIEATTADYNERPNKKHFLEGSVAGLNACRDKSPPQLFELMSRARRIHGKAMHGVLERYWRVTCFMHEVEWICNVISVVLVNEGIPPIVPPTARAVLVAASIQQEDNPTN